jgi:hypothetical protein
LSTYPAYLYDLDNFVNPCDAVFMANAKTLDAGAQKIVAGFKSCLEVSGSDVSPVRLAELVGIAFEQVFTGERKEDKLAHALARGLSVREKMAVDEGGSLSADETAHYLGISKQAAIGQYHAGKLLAWKTEKQGALRFPVWQFVDHRRLTGLPEVLEKLNASAMLDDWGKVGFFLQTNGKLNNRRPLDLLRENKLDLVLRAAEAYVE